MTQRPRVALLWGFALLLTGCVSTKVPSPKYLMGAKPGNAGVVYVFDMSVTQSSVNPSLNAFAVDFVCPALVDDKELADCKTFLDLLSHYSKAMVSERMALLANSIACYALPSGEYYAKPRIPGYGMDAMGELAAAKTGRSIADSFHKMLAHGGARFQSEPGKASIVWIQSIPSPDAGTMRLKSETIGIITDLDANPAEAQADLIRWVRGGVLARQYIAVLLLSKVGDRQAITPLQELASEDPRLAPLVQEVLTDIHKRLERNTSQRGVLTTPPPTPPSTPGPTKGQIVEYKGDWDFYLVGPAAPRLVVFRAPDFYFGYDSERTRLSSEYAFTQYSDIKGLSGRYVKTVTVDGSLLGSEVLRKTSTNAQGVISLCEISAPLVVVHSGTNPLSKPIAVRVLEEVKPLLSATAIVTSQVSASVAAPSAVKARTVDLGEGTKLDLAWIPPGTFLMGSPGKEPGNTYREAPQHSVTISRGFWMGKYEVTQEQWRQVMGMDSPSRFTGRSKRLPVENVDKKLCTLFLERLNKRMEEQNQALVFRLPTEAEWEYACRAGTTTPYFYGETLTPRMANFNGETTLPVGSFNPNAWGLYDMHGNVWEWCADGEREYTTEAQTDPKGTSGAIFRGGGIGFMDKMCRSASRNNASGYFNMSLFYIGLRVVAEPK